MTYSTKTLPAAIAPKPSFFHDLFTTAPSLLLLLSLLNLPSTVAQDVYAPFSGAIYIVGADGVQITAASPAYCPQYAGLSCSGIGYASW